MILALRTDKPEAELYLLRDGRKIAHETWQAHRELSDTLLSKIEELLASGGSGNKELEGIIVYQGPGSFTGLRIGITVANTLAYALGIPIATGKGEGWINDALKDLAKTPNAQVVIPHYGQEARITKPRK